MKICFFDAFSGISGDMSVGALCDAGADWETVRSALASLNLGASFELHKTKRKGIAASKFHVSSGEQKAHRHLSHIESLIAKGEISGKARKNATAVFQALGEVEAKMHQMPVEKVHFHEVGAVDSICDIVGACVALDALGVEAVYVSKINVGGGTAKTEHGVLPVPAPATAELLCGKPIYSAGPEMELTTPTGAALVSTLAAGFGRMPALTMISQGFGAGDLDFPDRANVLRVVVGEKSAAPEATTVTVMEANIDDSTPEVLGFAMERLLAEGALDVTLEPIYMKKCRPGTKLSVITQPSDIERLAAVLFAETSTLGLRYYEASRRVEERTLHQVETRFGPVRVKSSPRGTVSPEYDDCRRIALEQRIPLREVMHEAKAAFELKETTALENE